MTTNELQNVVYLETLILFLIMAIIISGIKRWKMMLCISSGAASVALFMAWTFVMAMGAALVYGSSSLLLWLELDRKAYSAHDTKRNITRNTCWVLLACGVLMLILKNIYNIYIYLN